MSAFIYGTTTLYGSFMSCIILILFTSFKNSFQRPWIKFAELQLWTRRWFYWHSFSRCFYYSSLTSALLPSELYKEHKGNKKKNDSCNLISTVSFPTVLLSIPQRLAIKQTIEVTVQKWMARVQSWKCNYLSCFQIELQDQHHWTYNRKSLPAFILFDLAKMFSSPLSLFLLSSHISSPSFSLTRFSLGWGWGGRGGEGRFGKICLRKGIYFMCLVWNQLIPHFMFMSHRVVESSDIYFLSFYGYLLNLKPRLNFLS